MSKKEPIENSVEPSLEPQTTVEKTRLSLAEAQKFLHEDVEIEPITEAELDEPEDSFEYSNDDAADETSTPEPSPNAERLHKLIARAGIASRRGAEEIVAQGRVMVNGKVVTETGSKADPSRDRIVVDGQPLHVPTTTTVVLMNKPLGVVSTKKDPEGRTTVTHLLPDKYKTLHPIGRLDYDTSGVLFLTDDGSLTQLLTHPSHGVEKVYWARVRGTVSVQTLKTLEAGIYLQDGKTAPCKARVRAQTENNALVQITLREGRNRQVRRMLDAVGHQVRALRRVRVASFALDGLLPGEFRVLLPGEVHALRKAAETKAKSKPATKPVRTTARPESRSDSRTEPTTSKPLASSRVAPKRDAPNGFKTSSREMERSTERFAERAATSNRSAAPNRSVAPRASMNERAASGERFSSSALTQRLARQERSEQRSERGQRTEQAHPLARRVAQSFDQAPQRSAENFASSAKAGKQAKPTRPPKAARVFAATTAQAAKASRIAAEKPRTSARSAATSKSPAAKPFTSSANGARPNTSARAKPAPQASQSKPVARRGDRPWGQKTRKRA